MGTGRLILVGYGDITNSLDTKLDESCEFTIIKEDGLEEQWIDCKDIVGLTVKELRTIAKEKTGLNTIIRRPIWKRKKKIG